MTDFRNDQETRHGTGQGTDQWVVRRVRTGLLSAAALILIAATPEPMLPIPPIPPPNPPTDTAAPMPDDAQRAPVIVAEDDMRVRLQLYRLRRYDGSRGFLPGSRFETSEERKAIQTPGLSVSVPLH